MPPRNLDRTTAKRIVRRQAAHEGLSSIKVASLLKLLDVCLRDAKLFPAKKKLAGQAYLTAWVRSYAKGLRNTIASRGIKAVTTRADPLVGLMLQAYEGVTAKRAKSWIDAHRKAMKHENLIGRLLEEYLAIRLRRSGWHCAWGSVIRHVDFVGPRGRLLQVKNRSNSENSASSSVREGTRIEKWHRLDARSGTDKWGDLNKLLGTNKRQRLNEKDFTRFVQSTLRQLAS